MIGKRKLLIFAIILASSSIKMNGVGMMWGVGADLAGGQVKPEYDNVKGASVKVLYSPQDPSELCHAYAGLGLTKYGVFGVAHADANLEYQLLGGEKKRENCCRERKKLPPLHAYLMVPLNSLLLKLSGKYDNGSHVENFGIEKELGSHMEVEAGVHNNSDKPLKFSLGLRYLFNKYLKACLGGSCNSNNEAKLSADLKYLIHENASAYLKVKKNLSQEGVGLGVGLEFNG